MGLGFPSQKVVNMDFLSPVSRPDRHSFLRKMRYLFVSSSSSPCSTPLRKSSITCESLWCWGFRFGIFSPITTFFFG